MTAIHVYVIDVGSGDGIAKSVTESTLVRIYNSDRVSACDLDGQTALVRSSGDVDGASDADVVARYITGDLLVRCDAQVPVVVATTTHCTSATIEQLQQWYYQHQHQHYHEDGTALFDREVIIHQRDEDGGGTVRFRLESLNTPMCAVRTVLRSAEDTLPAPVSINLTKGNVLSSLSRSRSSLRPSPPQPWVSFCITSLGRNDQVMRTLPVNIADNAIDRVDVEFVLVDFNTDDALQQFVLDRFPAELKCGYLRYYRTDALPHWHASVAKNTAHARARGRIVVNLDGDNYTGPRGGRYIMRQFDRFDGLHQFRRANRGDSGTYGRIACYRTDFTRIGGYNEDLLPMSVQDWDLIRRLQSIGVFVQRDDTETFCQAITNTKRESLANCSPSLRALGYNKMKRECMMVANKRFERRGGFLANDNRRIGVPLASMRHYSPETQSMVPAEADSGLCVALSRTEGIQLNTYIYTITHVLAKANIPIVPLEDADTRTIVVSFADKTWRKPIQRSDMVVLNGLTVDISKRTLAERHVEAFGYGPTVQFPAEVGVGRMMVKKNANYGNVLIAFDDTPEDVARANKYGAKDAYVLWKLIDNRNPNPLSASDYPYIDLRVPYYAGEKIPCVYIKHKPPTCRFKSAGAGMVTLEPTSKIFSNEEQERIARLCSLMNVDYCEMDVLRDITTNRIYVVDLNTTPTITRATLFSAQDREMGYALEARCLVSLLHRTRDGQTHETECNKKGKG